MAGLNPRHLHRERNLNLFSTIPDTAMLKRESNFEFLRIIAILMVLILHADFLAIKAPSYQQVCSEPTESGLRIFFEFLNIAAVNIFVMISGWFGINHSLKGVANLLFQTAYYLLITFFVMLLFGQTIYVQDSISKLTLISGNWFVKSYLILYLLAPALNMLIESYSRSHVKIIIVTFIGFMTFYGWCFNESVNWIDGGYSPIWFMGLYLLARYLHVYRPRSIMKIKSVYLIIFLILMVTMLTAGCVLQPEFLSTQTLYVYKFTFYNSPTTLLTAIIAIILTDRINLKSKAVNRLAKSSFAVYLIFCSPFIMDYYAKCFHLLYDHVQGLPYWFLVITIATVLYILTSIFDSIRIRLWNYIIHATKKSRPTLRS